MNIAVITSKYILDENKSILRVIRDHEGDWQFLDGHDITEKDARVVGLSQILDLDDSIRDILTLDNGMIAIRKSNTDKWIIQPL